MTDTPFPETLQKFLDSPRQLIDCQPGFYLVDKPAGYTSHDVVAKARRLLKTKRIGHGGTLDPLATGLLILMVGNATRLFDHLQQFDKEYVASFCLGQVTDSQDSSGQILTDNLVPTLEFDQAAAVLDTFTGQTSQLPPMHSAIKINGQPLYKLAHRGETIERETRIATAYNLQLLSLSRDTSQRYYIGEIKLTVASGFYVRTLIHDWGQKLKAGAIMTALRRTRIGDFTLADCHNIVN